eukprot:Blabericola_migrator_1__6789@NODE_3436_length_1777_cov_192_056725_g2136_i0_p1_GENE_NODE_3436_length_1777_cov_192_056725_g2136_i0NODE_3436_length_1777_cov_192_056725_g2136_i0_p1_ORF_typecomplete_len456_score83_06DUF3474/PF11960_8/0_19_NODE_3436_length_1777_cov_192_056725_g2136_i0881455
MATEACCLLSLDIWSRLKPFLIYESIIKLTILNRAFRCWFSQRRLEEEFMLDCLERTWGFYRPPVLLKLNRRPPKRRRKQSKFQPEILPKFYPPPPSWLHANFLLDVEEHLWKESLPNTIGIDKGLYRRVRSPSNVNRLLWILRNMDAKRQYWLPQCEPKKFVNNHDHQRFYIECVMYERDPKGVFRKNRMRSFDYFIKDTIVVKDNENVFSLYEDFDLNRRLPHLCTSPLALKACLGFILDATSHDFTQGASLLTDRIQLLTKAMVEESWKPLKEKRPLTDIVEDIRRTYKISDPSFLKKLMDTVPEWERGQKIPCDRFWRETRVDDMSEPLEDGDLTGRARKWLETCAKKFCDRIEQAVLHSWGLPKEVVRRENRRVDRGSTIHTVAYTTLRHALIVSARVADEQTPHLPHLLQGLMEDFYGDFESDLDVDDYDLIDEDVFRPIWVWGDYIGM